MEIIHFRNINDCLSFKSKLHNQTIERNNEQQVYQCMCKLVSNVDTNRVKVY